MGVSVQLPIVSVETANSISVSYFMGQLQKSP